MNVFDSTHCMNTLYLLAEDTEIVPTSVKVFTVVVIVLIRYNVV